MDAAVGRCLGRKMRRPFVCFSVGRVGRTNANFLWELGSLKPIWICLRFYIIEVLKAKQDVRGILVLIAVIADTVQYTIIVLFECSFQNKVSVAVVAAIVPVVLVVVVLGFKKTLAKTSGL